MFPDTKEKEELERAQQLVLEAYEARQNGVPDYSLEESKVIIKKALKN